MRQYNAGIRTQEKIVNSAKKLFYDLGYEKTTIKDICEEAKVIRTLFVYYFKDKADLADYISNSINNKLLEAAIQELNEKKFVIDDLVFDIYSSAWFFISIMSDRNLNRFYAEILGGNSAMLLGNEFYRNIFKGMYRTCGKNTDSKEFELFFIYNTTPPGAFLKQYLNGLIDLTKEEIVEFMNRQVLNGLSIEKKRQDDIIKRTMILIKESKLDFKDIFLRSL